MLNKFKKSHFLNGTWTLVERKRKLVICRANRYIYFMGKFT